MIYAANIGICIYIYIYLYTFGYEITHHVFPDILQRTGETRQRFFFKMKLHCKFRDLQRNDIGSFKLDTIWQSIRPEEIPVVDWTIIYILCFFFVPIGFYSQFRVQEGIHGFVWSWGFPNRLVHINIYIWIYNII
jgi:hypothetical protein